MWRESQTKHIVTRRTYGRLCSPARYGQWKWLAVPSGSFRIPPQDPFLQEFLMNADVSMNPEGSTSANRRAWTAPAVIDLPTLTDLTLQSGGGGAPPAGDAVTVTGGSSGLVF